MAAAARSLSGKAAALVAEAPVFHTSEAVASMSLSVLHSLTYLPLLVVIALQDVHLKLALALNLALCVCLALGNLCWANLGVVKVFPKRLDCFLLVLYASMLPVAYLHPAWLFTWVVVYHSAAVALCMWLTILLPFWDDFVLEALRDRLEPELARLPDVAYRARAAALVWACALTVMAFVALPSALFGLHGTRNAVHVACDYALPLAALLAASVAQRLLSRGAFAAAKAWPPRPLAEADAGRGTTTGSGVGAAQASAGALPPRACSNRSSEGSEREPATDAAPAWPGLAATLGQLACGSARCRDVPTPAVGSDTAV